MTANAPVVLVQFGAKSCLPCRAIREKIGKWSDMRAQTGAVYVSVEKFPRLAAQLGIFSVPTVIVYVDGRPTVRESGYFGLDEILIRAERYLELLEN